MAKFKNQDLILDDNERIYLGDDDDAYFEWDGAFLLTNHLLRHNIDGYYATRQWVEQTVAALEWQDSVLSYTTDVPASPSAGDRYIVPSGASGTWTGQDDNIAEYSNTWSYTTPSAGFATWVIDEGLYRVWNGSDWIRLGGVVDHGALVGLADDDHTQYHNDTRGDARYYTQVLLDGGQLDNRYYTETETLTLTQNASAFAYSEGVNYTDTITVEASANAADVAMDYTDLITAGLSAAVPKDHGDLLGLSDDDHPIYLPTDGSRGMTGTLSVGTTGGYIKFSGSSAEIGFSTDTDLLTLETGAAPSATINGGLVVTDNIFINDTENTKNTLGLTIHQGGAGDEIISLKSTNVIHGLTGTTETDTYGTFKKTHATYGGLAITSIIEDQNYGIGLQLSSYGGTPTTQKDTSAYGLITAYATEHNAGSITNVSADANLFIVRTRKSNLNVAMWLCDANGDTYQDGDVLPFDDGTQSVGNLNRMWGNIYTDALTVSSGNITMYGDILPATSDTYDLGHSDAVWDNIWCKTLHASAGTINLGSIALTDSSGELLVDGTAVPSLSTTQAASANAVSVAETYSNSASANAYTKSAAYTDTQVGATGVNKGYDSVATTSGTYKNITGISEDAVQINVSWHDHSNNNASYAPIIELYNQSARQTTGYDGTISSGSSQDRNDTDGIHFANLTSDHAASDVYDGHLIITRMNSAGTIWAWEGQSIADAESGKRTCIGYVTLSSAFGGTLRITSESAGATLDGGTFYVSWF